MLTEFSVEMLRAWLSEPVPEMGAEVVVGVVIFALGDLFPVRLLSCRKTPEM